jgi:hypothetical protein
MLYPGCMSGRHPRGETVFAWSAALYFLISTGVAAQTTDEPWTTPERVSMHTAGHAWAPVVRSDPSGRAIAVWLVGPLREVWTSRFEPARGWEPPLLLGRGGFPDVGLDARGNGVVVWAGRPSVLAARYLTEGGWSSEVDALGGAGAFARLDVNRGGAGATVWLENRTERTVIWVNLLTADSGWGEGAIVQGEQARTANSPEIAISDDGSAIAVWTEVREGGSEIWSRHFAPGRGWADPHRLSVPDGSLARTAEIAMNASGAALVAWALGSSSVWCASFSPETGWSPPRRLDTLTEGADFPQVALDDRGNGFVVWRQSVSVGLPFVAVWGATRIEDTWRPSRQLSAVEPVDASNATIAVAANGTALASWRRVDGRDHSVWASHFAVGRGWAAPQNVSSTRFGGDISNMGDISATIADDGRAILVWSAYDGTRHHTFAATSGFGEGRERSPPSRP